MNETIIKHGSVEVKITTTIQSDGKTAVVHVSCGNSEHFMLTTAIGLSLHMYGKVVEA